MSVMLVSYCEFTNNIILLSIYCYLTSFLIMNVTIIIINQPAKLNIIKYIFPIYESIVKQKFNNVKNGLNVKQCIYIVYQIPP